MSDVDAELAEMMRRDDPDGAEQLVERYGDRVYRLALRITGARVDAEEAVEEVLRRAVRMIPTLTDDLTLGSWIERAAAKAAYHKLRNRGRYMNEITLADVVPSLAGDGRHFGPMDDWSNRLNEQTLQGELQNILTDAIDALPADYRTALVLHDVEGASKPDIAEVLGADVSATKSHLHHARLFVRKRLSEYFESAGVA